MYRNLASYTKRDRGTGTRQTYVWESTWDADGNRIEIETPVNPYFYVEDLSNSAQGSCVKTINESLKLASAAPGVVDTYCARSIHRNPLTKFTFSNTTERNAATSSIYEIPLYEKLSPTRQYLLDKYIGQEYLPEFSKHPFRIFFFDLEVKIENEFPNPAHAKYPINVISIYDTLENKIHVWTCHETIYELMDSAAVNKIKSEAAKYDKSGAEICIYTFKREKQLLESFIEFWTTNYPDIISGWNIDKFDIPYLVHRLNRIDSSGRPLSIFLSPLHGYISEPIRTIKNAKDGIDSYSIAGLTTIDYMRLYKKFDPTSKQSFKLDYIAKYELDIGKVDYEELGYDSLKEFMIKDFIMFIAYNVVDTVLIKLLDDSLRYITLARLICNIGLCEYENILKSIPYILGALTIQSRNNNLKFLTDANHTPPPPEKDITKMSPLEQAEYEEQLRHRKKQEKKESTFKGAFVVETTRGCYRNGVGSFDFNSLYPNIIMTLNISPETKVGKLELSEDADPFSLPELTLISRGDKRKVITQAQLQHLLKTNCTMSSNFVLYAKPSKQFGVVPQFLDRMYKERVRVKGLLKQTKKKILVIDDAIAKLEKQLALCDK